jgi:hypothetical protein
VHVGFIGTSESADAARRFFGEICSGVPGDADHEPFPGCSADRGYRCEVHAELVEPIKRHEATDILGVQNGRQRFEAFLDLLQKKMDLITSRDHPLDYIVLALPQELYLKCRSVEYAEKGLGPVYRNLRRAFKAMAMGFGKPTQILLATTTGLTTSARKLDHPSKIAWNLLTGLYFKVEGLPWGPTELEPGTCHIGISFYRPLGETSTLRTSVVQAFDSNGEGLVLRGHKFHWDEEKEGRSPHLPAEQAQQLVDLVLARYTRENEDRPPLRVVIHKTSRFEPEERAGFEQALRGVSRYDLVSLAPTSEVRLLRSGQYPPLRGTVFTIGDVSYCYTSGYLRHLGCYPHGHVPSPLQVADHVGDTPKSQLLREILVLTKMNWNSANMSGLMPITLRFSRLVGDVLREVSEDREPEAKSWYYM